MRERNVESLSRCETTSFESCATDKRALRSSLVFSRFLAVAAPLEAARNGPCDWLGIRRWINISFSTSCQRLPQEGMPLLRACITIVAVALLSASFAHLRDAQGQRFASATTDKVMWVRTIDGWEPSTALTISPLPPDPPKLDPLLVALLQVGLSMFALLALPTATRVARKS